MAPVAYPGSGSSMVLNGDGEPSTGWHRPPIVPVGERALSADSAPVDGHVAWKEGVPIVIDNGEYGYPHPLRNVIER